jgi:S1-C subfamily serine protease
VRGFDDEIYRKFRAAFNQLSTRPIPFHASSHEFLLENATWVIECASIHTKDGKTSEDCAQGTAFFLKDIGIVTCAHCLGNVRNYICHPSAPAKEFDVEVVAKSDDIDLAILRMVDVDQQPSAAFIQSTDSNFVQRGDKIVVAGYPDFGRGDQLTIRDGQVSSIKMISGIRRFHISAPLSHGNSGGPVLNSRKQVTGVAATGVDNVFGVIPIAALEHIMPRT